MRAVNSSLPVPPNMVKMRTTRARAAMRGREEKLSREGERTCVFTSELSNPSPIAWFIGLPLCRRRAIGNRANVAFCSCPSSTVTSPHVDRGQDPELDPSPSSSPPPPRGDSPGPKTPVLNLTVRCVLSPVSLVLSSSLPSSSSNVLLLEQHMIDHLNLLEMRRL